jgi:hypothetical protein
MALVPEPRRFQVIWMCWTCLSGLAQANQGQANGCTSVLRETAAEATLLQERWRDSSISNQFQLADIFISVVRPTRKKDGPFGRFLLAKKSPVRLAGARERGCRGVAGRSSSHGVRTRTGQLARQMIPCASSAAIFSNRPRSKLCRGLRPSSLHWTRSLGDSIEFSRRTHRNLIREIRQAQESPLIFCETAVKDEKHMEPRNLAGTPLTYMLLLPFLRLR